ncbi:MAG: EamA family transporter [Lachnospiraceae bacterium]|nr:EamA family transporter [Lachnospiraceae bacterium]
MVWVGLVTLYGILKGVREILKKKALGRNTVMEVLLMYTLLSFLILLPTAPKAGGLRAPEYAAVFAKSFIIFVAWLCSFHALSCMPVSLYGILDMSRVVFSTLLGIIVIREKMDLPGLIGFVLVCAGLYALRGLKNREEAERTTTVVQENATAPETDRISAVTVPETTEEPETTATPEKPEESPLTGEQRFWNRLTSVTAGVVILAFMSSFLNAVSGTMDKVLMKGMNESQMQFWYMLFLVLLYLVYILITGTKIRLKGMFTNKYVWMLSVAFIIADRALFIANRDPASRVTVMTLLKQSGVICTIIGGRLFFREKHIKYKLCCAFVVIAGIVIAVIPFGQA